MTDVTGLVSAHDTTHCSSHHYHIVVVIVRCKDLYLLNSVLIMLYMKIILIENYFTESLGYFYVT